MRIIECCGLLKPFVSHVRDLAGYSAANGYKATDFKMFEFCPFCGEKVKFKEIIKI